MRLLLHPALANAVVLPPLVLLMFAWIVQSRSSSIARNRGGRYRISVLSLLLLTVGVAMYFVLPILADTLEPRDIGPHSDPVYRAGIIAGWGCAVFGTLFSAFSWKGERLLLLGSGITLIGVWFFVGALI